MTTKNIYQEFKIKAERVYSSLLIEIDNSRIIYMGGTSAAGEAEFISRIYTSVIFVDDRKAGSTLHGKNIISTQELAKNISKNDFLIINCLTPAGFNHFSRQAASLGISHCSITEVLSAHHKNGMIMSFSGLTSVYGPAFHIHTLKNLGHYELLRNVFVDALSIRTFDNLIKYRLSGDPSFLQSVAIGHNYGKIQHDSYILNSQFFNLSKDEVFIDAGALDGSSSKYFIESVDGDFEKIVMFEPSSESAQKCYQTIEELDKKFPSKKIKEKTFIVEAGLYDRKGVLPISLSLFDQDVTNTHGAMPQSAHFIETGFSNAFIEKGNEYNVINVPITTLDDYIGEKPVSFIKFEIEGSEVAALQGATKTIVKNKPKLALSIYHRPQDLEMIINYISDINIGYNMALRAHNPFCPDAIVLYCWI